jgi:hypothetical protein
LERYYCLEGETYWRDITAWKVRHIGEIIINKIFGKKMLLNIKYVLCFSVQFYSETVLVLRRTERDVIKNVNGSSSCKVPVILVRF